MDENNNQEIQVPKEPTKREKAEQAGKDIAEVAAKGAANYFGGPVGGAIVNKVAQTKLGQNVLNAAGKNLASNPVTKNALAKAQPGIQKAKPMLNAAANSLGGNVSDAAKGISNSDGTSPSNPLTSSSSSNSGFGNNQSGLFSNSNKQNNNNNGNITDFSKKLSKAKKIMKIISVVAPILLIIISLLAVVAVVMGQIMTVRDSIEDLARKFTTGIEKFVNFAQGDGWMTNEEYFFDYLNDEYEKFPATGGESLDIPLIAATIHYSTTVDFEQYEEEIANDDMAYIEDNDFEQLGGILTKDQTSSFYNVAQDKLGSVNSIYPGEKRLLGHLVDTEITIDYYPLGAEALNEWKIFLNYIGQSVGDTADDVISAMTKFVTIYEEYASYHEITGDALAGEKYDYANLVYEAQEFYYNFEMLYKEITGQADVVKDENGNTQLVNKNGGWFDIPTPIVKRTMNYGYDEYKQMKQDMLEMKAILRKENISFETDEDVEEYAKNSTNTELKSFYDSYIANKEKYLYSYTHYLKEVYIPFTYFYNQEYGQSEIDIIIEEIYDQRDFFEYLIGDGNKKSTCGSTQAEDLVDLTNEEFIEFIGPIARLEYSKTGILASVTIAQAILETHYGNITFEGTNNLFNIKCGTTWDNCKEFETGEEYNPGEFTAIVDSFRVYESVEQSIEDHSRLLMSKHYEGITDTADYKEQIRILKERGYATSSIYDQVYIELIEDWNLTKWDTIVDTTDTSTTCVEGDYTEWKQYDKQWANVVIGDGYTIQEIGCLATAVSIQMAHSNVLIKNINGEFNPGTFVEAIKPNGFVDANGNPGGTRFVYDSPALIAPTFRYQGNLHVSLTGKTQSQKASEIQSLINQGCYVVMEVKGNGGGEHWVAVDYVENGRVYMMDPASTEVDTWNLYPHSWTTQAVCYKVID